MFTRRILGPIVPLLLVAAPVLVAPAATAAPHSQPGSTHAVAFERHSCTRTSSGSCIRGGQFCPRSKYHHSGWDAKGRRYVCKGSHSHPHWMKP